MELPVLEVSSMTQVLASNPSGKNQLHLSVQAARATPRATNEKRRKAPGAATVTTDGSRDLQMQV